MADPVSEIKRRIVHAAREERMVKHPYFGDDWLDSRRDRPVDLADRNHPGTVEAQHA